MQGHICIHIYIFLWIVCKYVTTYSVTPGMGKDLYILVLVTTTVSCIVHCLVTRRLSYDVVCFGLAIEHSMLLLSIVVLQYLDMHIVK
jgi:ABC-type multidrug transport system permease subunit